MGGILIFNEGPRRGRWTEVEEEKAEGIVGKGMSLRWRVDGFGSLIRVTRSWRCMYIHWRL